MKRSISILLLIAGLFILPACSNDKKKTEETKTEGKEVNDKAPVTNDTPAAIAAQWCELNGKEFRASEAEKEAAKAARKEFEEAMQIKYKDNQAFLDEVGKEIEKCEDASEGK